MKTFLRSNLNEVISSLTDEEKEILKKYTLKDLIQAISELGIIPTLVIVILKFCL